MKLADISDPIEYRSKYAMDDEDEPAEEMEEVEEMAEEPVEAA